MIENRRGIEDMQFDVKVGQLVRGIVFTSEWRGQHDESNVLLGRSVS